MSLFPQQPQGDSASQAARNPPRLRLTFWGVRGSIPTPQVENLRFGGNTSCLEVRGPDNEICIFDGGTGLRQLGNSLLHEFRDQKLTLNFFSSHVHWDHIQGVPFFAPLYDVRHHVTFHSSSASQPLQQMLEGLMKAPYFPVDFRSLGIRRGFVRMDSAPVKCGELTIQAFPLNHPQGGVGYRIESSDAILVYASDLEHGHEHLDSVLREYARDADLLIYDAQYTPEEYESHRGWGHSTWEQGIRVAEDAGAKKLILFHHDPGHNDDFLDRVVEQARRRFENTEGAREGLTISI